ncbi:bifunctional DNA-formamidopyrimidine glycosylase/DNA-(apurinic or apyrimidinic site) lyase [Methylogaea oryzae]|nr:bifunctional DNA-formamidopyrimidine glycosylase/DNA-(apurinic or apyrimidinic site) lyase [Methylogaea oryzae]
MPELPEVETTRLGLAPHLVGQTVTQVLVRESRLRWPVPGDLPALLQGETAHSLKRRGKYLLFGFRHGTLIAHLGMSGSLRLAQPDEPLKKHDHIDLCLSSGAVLRYHDPRRFGAMVWTADASEAHPLLASLGPEPLDDAFDGDHLHKLAENRSMAVKLFIMDSKIVVGVGNIYASEALFRAGIDPRKAAGGISRARYRRLGETIKAVLAEAIRQGGTTLRDFVNGHGQPGYFQQTLNVYGREGLPCPACGAAVRCLRLGQRSTFFCPTCQR